ncbi:Hypothetical predicted protein [Paramuricea clavata]|uniref:Uncharacterized protein n=1 Tax=Paramuricea clavata TaxID=317549 RepID=A0A6S7FYT1_PARCT|nr:Hypothetical predicted protein [Paramuricea clavata]CAB3985515.1 Hypothetical predicted protein [Paramuricea clavata]
MADDVEHFLEFVLKRSEEISLQENEDILSELLKHIYLLGRTVQLLEEIRDFVVNAGEPDSGKWQQLVNVYCEIESEFICLYNRELSNSNYRNMPTTVVN